jgi:hypothetical protein
LVGLTLVFGSIAPQTPNTRVALEVALERCLPSYSFGGAFSCRRHFFGTNHRYVVLKMLSFYRSCSKEPLIGSLY